MLCHSRRPSGEDGGRILRIRRNVVNRWRMAKPEPHRRGHESDAQQQSADQDQAPAEPQLAAREDEGDRGKHGADERKQGGERHQLERNPEPPPARAPAERCGRQRAKRQQGKNNCGPGSSMAPRPARFLRLWLLHPRQSAPQPPLPADQAPAFRNPIFTTRASGRSRRTSSRPKTSPGRSICRARRSRWNCSRGPSLQLGPFQEAGAVGGFHPKP
jgi:hypothetical protein